MPYGLIKNINVAGANNFFGPTGGVYAFGSVWFSYYIEGNLHVYRLNPNDGAITAHMTAAPVPLHWNVWMGANANFVYAFYLYGGGVPMTHFHRINPATNTIVNDFTPGVLSFGANYHTATTPDGNIWVGHMVQGLTRYDLDGNATVAIVAATSGGASAYDPINGFVWQVSGNTLLKVDPATNLIVDSIVVINEVFNDIHFAFGSMWVTSSGTGVFRYNPVTKALLALIPRVLGAHTMSQVSSDQRYIGINDAGGGGSPQYMVLIDPYTNTVFQPGVGGYIIPTYSAGSGGLASLVGVPAGNGFFTGNYNHTTPGLAFVDLEVGNRSRRHRGGELWNIVPEVSNYLG